MPAPRPAGRAGRPRSRMPPAAFCPLQSNQYRLCSCSSRLLELPPLPPAGWQGGKVGAAINEIRPQVRTSFIPAGEERGARDSGLGIPPSHTWTGRHSPRSRPDPPSAQAPSHRKRAERVAREGCGVWAGAAASLCLSAGGLSSPFPSGRSGAVAPAHRWLLALIPGKFLPRQPPEPSLCTVPAEKTDPHLALPRAQAQQTTSHLQ